MKDSTWIKNRAGDPGTPRHGMYNLLAEMAEKEEKESDEED